MPNEHEHHGRADELPAEGQLRLIIDPAQNGVLNMATDEAILQAVGAGESPPTLRFYRWDEPTISLGYFQKYDEFLQQDEVIRNLAVVRRQTGGGAILHDDEITYSLVLPTGENSDTDIELMYRLVHDAFIATLAELAAPADYRGGQDRGNAQRGPFFCFARKHRLDLVIGADKLLGSAQRRIRNAVLQHGSLIFGRHFLQQPSAALNDAIAAPLDSKVFLAEAAQKIGDGLGKTVANGELTDLERSTLPTLQSKYAGDEWNRQR